jgi:hypothetical protein
MCLGKSIGGIAQYRILLVGHTACAKHEAAWLCHGYVKSTIVSATSSEKTLSPGL